MLDKPTSVFPVCKKNFEKCKYNHEKKIYCSRKCRYKVYCIKNKERLAENTRRYNSKPHIKEKRKRYLIENKEWTEERRKRYVLKNKEIIKEKQKLYRIKNKEILKQKRKEYYLKNKERRLKQTKEWCLKNKERRKLNSIKYKEKRKERRKFLEKNSIKHQIAKRIKKTMNAALFKQKVIKSKKTLELLGCSWQEARDHLESQFKEGMTWENRGFYGWHIDHIIPISSFDLTDPEQQKKCFHYTNLQPLWWHENLSKGAKILENPESMSVQ